MAVRNTFLVAEGIRLLQHYVEFSKKIIEEKIRNDLKTWHKCIVSRAETSSKNNDHFFTNKRPY